MEAFLSIGASALSAAFADGTGKASMGARRMGAAVTCARHGAIAENRGEQARLFLDGSAQGKAFMEAARSIAPLSASFRKAGPSAAFVLGRIYEGAAKAAHDAINGDGHLKPEDRRIEADAAFHKANCALLG